MRGYLDDAISIDVLQREQKRITEEHALRSSQLAILSERIAQTEELKRIALRLVENCQEAYGKASPETKKLFDKAFFKRLVVQQKKIAQVHYQAPFDTLLTAGFVSNAWRRTTEQIQNFLERLRRLTEGRFDVR